MDIFQRAMDPKAPPTPTPATRAAANTSDEALPMPPEAGTVLPSSILAQILPISSITAKTDCELPQIAAAIERETNKARDLQGAYYGNPGNSGLARTPAEGAVLERAGDPELRLCGMPTNFSTKSPEWQAAEEQKKKEIGEIGAEESRAMNACPGISGGKDPACEKSVMATSRRKMNDATLRYLKAMTQPFDVPASGADIYRNFTIPMDLPENKWVKAVEFRPSARKVVHHSLFFLDTTGESRKHDGEDGKVGYNGGLDGTRFAKSGRLGGWAVGGSAGCGRRGRAGNPIRGICGGQRKAAVILVDFCRGKRWIQCQTKVRARTFQIRRNRKGAAYHSIVT